MEMEMEMVLKMVMETVMVIMVVYRLLRPELGQVPVQERILGRDLVAVLRFVLVELVLGQQP